MQRREPALKIVGGVTDDEVRVRQSAINELEMDTRVVDVPAHSPQGVNLLGAIADSG